MHMHTQTALTFTLKVFVDIMHINKGSMHAGVIGVCVCVCVCISVLILYFCDS